MFYETDVANKDINDFYCFVKCTLCNIYNCIFWLSYLIMGSCLNLYWSFNISGRNILIIILIW